MTQTSSMAGGQKAERSISPGQRVGVVLLQLGGPDSLESVEPFLENLFRDPDIINLPFAFLFRNRLARFIARKRGPKVQQIYRQIGRRSPILKLTRRQATALEHALDGHLDAKVYIAMRYWHPRANAVVNQLLNDGIENVVLLPLYPHYSKTTTGSSINEWNRILKERGLSRLSCSLVEQYCDHPEYIAAVVSNIGIALRRVPAEKRGKVHLVFSAHGTPTKLVKNGDPYQKHVIRTYNAVIAEGKFNLPHHLCYQSKVGPQEWLKPSLDETIERLAGESVLHMIVIPIAFVSDHSETLFEINMEAREKAKKLGIKHFDMSPALNTNPHFIAALADLVSKSVEAM